MLYQKVHEDMISIIVYILIGVLTLSRQVECGCSDHGTCVTCTKDTSWSGEPCRWCPVTKTCHAHGSWLNSCSITQNIVDPSKCSFVQEDYSASTAYKMALLSAVAYSDDALTYLDKALPNQKFQHVFQVTKDCSGDAKCSGYCAVSHVDKIIIVAFRGSETTKQVTVQALETLKEAKKDLPAGGHVQSYFYDAFDLIWSSLKPTTYSLIADYPDYRVFVTGHSLGGALASIGSTTIVHDGVSSNTRIVLYTFGQPRVGDYEYAKKHDELVKASWRVVHYRDVVSHLPFCYSTLGLCTGFKAAPYHHGTEIFYSQREMIVTSSYTKCLGLPHNEDVQCSNSPGIWAGCVKEMDMCISDHKEYFEITIGDWWKTA